MRIQLVYYYPLCLLKLNAATYTCLPRQNRFSSYTPKNIAANENVYVAQNTDRKIYTEEEILQLRKSPEHFAGYVRSIQPDDVHVFILTAYQLPDFLEDMELMGLSKYLVHKATPAVNKNYLDNGAILFTMIYHFKDFKNA